MLTTGYLIDTNILAQMVAVKHPDRQNDPKVKCVERKWTAVKDSGQLFICAPVVGEVEYGLRIMPTKDSITSQQMRLALEAFPAAHEIDVHVARECYAELKARLFQKYAPKTSKGKAKSKYLEDWIDGVTGKTMGVTENDVWIAAVAICHNLVLVTNDGMRHIAEVAGDSLVIEDWTVC